MKRISHIARDEWRLMRRDRVALLGLLLLTLLSLVAAVTAWEARRATDAQRARYQAQAEQEFEAQPDRHPHRMVHYGHFVFRPLQALAAFDAGIDAYTGHTLFLEGHRQNSANFGDVRQSSLLLRFGQLTPALVLQLLAPLLLIFLGHGAVARERESGTLRLLLAQGVRPGEIVAGKLLALAGVAGLILLPAAAALLAIGATALTAVLLAGYAAWLLLWAGLVTLLSCLLARRRDALLGLLALWAVTVILLPRLAADGAATAHRLATRFESDIAVAREYAALGDSHDPDDPYFAAFRARVLAQYGVATVEALPVNYKGLVGMEGERLSSALFARHAHAAFEQQGRQSRWADAFALLSPTIALRRLSMGAAGTDLASHRRFLEQGERYRYELVQALNRLQVEHVHYADDSDPRKQMRVARSHWQGFPAFRPEAAPIAGTLQDLTPAALALLAWLLATGACLALAARRLARIDR